LQKIILHIGYPKTGTTWFQKMFYPNVSNYTYFNRKEFKEKLLLPEDIFFNYAYEKTKNNNYIICEEKILGVNNKNLLNKQKIERLYKAFPNAEIVVFIRNQINIIESSYSQYIHSGGTMTPTELILFFFISNKIKRWNYYNYLKQYIDTFGKNKLNIFLYEDFKTNYNEFIKDFISKFNLDIKQNILNKKVNKSYTSIMLKTARFTNKFSKTQIDFNRPDEVNYIDIPYLHQISHKIYSKLNIGKPFNLQKNINKFIFNRLYDYFIDDNKKLAKEFNLDLKKYDYPM